jgi:hypothetical protein
MCQLSDSFSWQRELGGIAPGPGDKFLSDFPTCLNEVQWIEILSDPSAKSLVNFINLEGDEISILSV